MNPDPAQQPAATSADDGAAYPTEHVLAVVAPAQIGAALDALAAAGFHETEIEARCGAAEADQLDATTGRTGLLDRVLRVAERLGIRNDELKLKDQYEDALRANQFVVNVHAPTEDRRDRAARVLAEHGARLVNYFGRFTIERIAP